MIDEEKAKAEEAAQEELEQKLERLEGNLGNIRFVCFFIIRFFTCCANLGINLFATNG